MSAAAVLVIVIAAGEAQTPMTQALLAAATESLAGNPSVALFPAAALSDAEALRVEETAGARAVAQVIWRDRSRTHATIRLHVARTDRWVDRSLTFSDADNLSERGRTLGFAVASMLPEGDSTLRATPPQPDAQPSSTLAAPPATVAPPATTTSTPARRFAELSMIGGDDFQGIARGLGGALDVGLPAGETFALRFSAGLRGGALSSVSATGLNVMVGAGAAWSPWPDPADRRLNLALRVDALLIVQAVRHTHGSGDSEWKATPLPGADALVEVSWRLTRELHAVLGAGLEAALGTVDVSVVTSTQTHTATIPALRAVGQAGLRLYF
ncbi:MAG: hypothetical protein QOI66_686 [Myxococcales bacterium]|nr:hypothetical protein [Myxococcales bacterium]